MRQPRQHTVGIRTIDVHELEIRRLDWPDGGQSFEAHGKQGQRRVHDE